MLKAELVKCATASEQRKLQQLIISEELSNHKPTQLLPQPWTQVCMPWIFIVVDVQQRILAADFLRYFGLLVNMKQRQLIDTLTHQISGSAGQNGGSNFILTAATAATGAGSVISLLLSSLTGSPM